jgi:WD40 repeat protein/DNA-binding CsgD family transcriptional regulator
LIPQNALKALAIQHGVSDTELEVLSLALNGKSMAEIAKELGINSTAVRKRLGEVYKKFGITGSGPGKLAKLQQLLIAQYQDHLAKGNLVLSGNESNDEVAIAPPIQYWEEMIDDDSFYGREAELAELERWILQDHCRLVALLGIGGVGKTTLSVKLAERIGDKFQRVVWRSLNSAPPLKNILVDLIQELSDGQEIYLPDHTEERLSRLLEYLKTQRYLIVLDSIEMILRTDDFAGHYREGYENYGELLRRIGKTAHHSCLVITSGEKPRDFVLLESKKVRSFQLSGLKESEGSEIFKEKGFSFGSKDDWKKIIELYSGNPLVLKIVAVTIQELFGGNISEFLKQGTTVFGNIRSLLDQQFDRLLTLEKEILYWLAINREPISLSTLRDDLVSPVAQLRLLEALESLGRRSLVEKDAALFSLQPVVMEYVSDRFIEQVCEEIKTKNIGLFNSHALIKAKAKDYLKEMQVRYLLKPLEDKLLNELGSERAIAAQLGQILDDWRQQAPLKPGYAAGNVLNLLSQSQPEISNWDFSALAVWQAHLQDVSLHDVNFTRADLTQSVFAETLSSILSVAFSPDGTFVATGGVDRRIRLWLVATGEQVVAWQGHSDWVRSLSFSPDGKRLVSGSHDQTVRLWEVETGQCCKTFEGHTNWVRSVAFNSDGQMVASGSSDGTVKLWDAITGNCLQTFEEWSGIVRSIAFSPDGQLLASGSSDGTVKLWNLITGKCCKVLKEHRRGVRSVTFSPDGQMLASGSSDATVKLWDLLTGQCVNTLAGHLGWVWSVVFSCDGRLVASGSEDQTVKLWEVSTGKCLMTLYGHTGWVRSIAFSPDHQTLASGSEDQTVRLWNVKTGQRLKTFQGYARGVRSVAFSPDGRILASGSEDRTVRIWNIDNGHCLITLRKHTGRIWSVAFAPQRNSKDNHILASGSEDRTVRIWDLETGQCLKTLYGHEDGVLSVAFSPNGQLLVTGSSDRTIRLWNIRTGQCLQTLRGHTGWVWSVDFSPTGKTFASGSGDLTVRLWQVGTEECLQILQGHTHWVRSVAFSPDGKTLASSSVGRTVRLWDVSTGQYLQPLEGYSNGVRSVAFSPDGQILASGGDDHVVRLWDIQSGQCLHVLRGHSSRVRSVTFSQDGRILASGSNDEAIKLWDVKTGAEIKTLKIRKPYEGMDITDATGITESQKATLIALGARDRNLPKF